MFVINANANQEILTNVKYISNIWQIYDFWENFYQGFMTLTDATNKYVYFVYNLNNAPYLKIIRFFYGNWKMENPTLMTLSGFWTFTSWPGMYVFQWSNNWNFKIYFSTNWWSWSITALTIYNLTFSWTTATLSSANTLPVIASYSVGTIFVKGDNIYVFYHLTASPYTCDTGRKWNGTSWVSLTGVALPSSLWTIANYNSSITFWWYNSFYYWTKMWAWTNRDNFYIKMLNWSTNAKNLIFNSTTESWSLCPVNLYSISSDVNGFLMTSWNIIYPDWTIIEFNTTSSYGSWLVMWTTDIINWFFTSLWVSSTSFYLSWYFKWNWKLRRVSWTPAQQYWILYSLDNGVTWTYLNYITNMISDNYLLNYSSSNLIVIPFWPTTWIVITTEISI